MEFLDFIDVLKEKNINLTEPQTKAIQFNKGYMLLLAVPGSGKTLTSICRIGKLIYVDNIEPSSICSITFSKAAAIEMIKRYKKLFGNNFASKPYFSTIHSLAYLIVRDYFKKYNLNYTVIENSKSKLNKTNLLKDIYIKTTNEYPSEEAIENVKSAISYYKNYMLLPNKLAFLINNNKISLKENLEESFIDMYTSYVNIEKEQRLMDYDDMLLMAYNILRRNKYFFQKYSNMFKYIQVDEAQDMSVVQYKILKILCNNKENMVLYGDDDQTLYTFRSANPKLLLNIKDDFPETQILYMEQNFRSSFNIVNVFNEFVKNNKARYKKEMFSNNKNIGSITVLDCDCKQDEMSKTLDILNSINLSETAILARQNISLIYLINDFSIKKIPFKTYSLKDNFTNHWIVNDILEIYQFSKDMYDINCFSKIYYKFPDLYLSKFIIEKLKKSYKKETNILSFMITNAEILCLKTTHIYKLKKLLQQLKILNNIDNAYKGLDFILHSINYNKYLANKNYDGTSILTALIYISKTCTDFMNFINRLKLISTIINDKTLQDDNGVTLISMHSSKGLEWQNVVITDFVNDVIPGKVETDTETEDERRNAYVAFTRSKQNLYITYCNKNSFSLQKPSIFLNELLKSAKDKNTISIIDNKIHANQLQPGDKIKHKTLGEGTIVNLNDTLITANFNNNIKKLSLDVCIENGLISLA